MATISIHHVLASLQGNLQTGANHRVLLARAGINPTYVDRPDARVHTDQVARLFRLVQQQLDDEFMGFTATPVRFGVFATMCDLVSHCKTLGELLQKSIHFYNLTSRALQMQLTVESNHVELSFTLTNPELDPQHFLTEFWLVIWHRFPSWYIGEAIRLRETHFSHPPPAHLNELKIMFPGNLLFDQPRNGLTFDPKYLDKPLMRTDRELETFLLHHPVDIMTIPGEDNSLEAQIERIILKGHSGSLVFPSANQLAEAMETSPLSLYRRLQQEGTSYQKIKDNIRLEIAIDKLVNDELSVDQVSEILGFAEPRSFTRAFKQWTGLTPRKYCNYHRGN